MRKECGKQEQRERMIDWKTCVLSSTKAFTLRTLIRNRGVKVVFVQRLFRKFHPSSSTYFYPPLPLFEYIFYPFSTPPIIKVTILNF